MGRHATGVAREDGEQVVFFRRQLDRRPVPGDETLVKIHDRAFDLHPAGRLGRLGRLPGASAMETRSRLTLSPPPSIRDMSSRLATNRKGRPVSSSIDDKSSIRSAGSSCRQARGEGPACAVEDKGVRKSWESEVQQRVSHLLVFLGRRLRAGAGLRWTAREVRLRRSRNGQSPRIARGPFAFHHKHHILDVY